MVLSPFWTAVSRLLRVAVARAWLHVRPHHDTTNIIVILFRIVLYCALLHVENKLLPVRCVVPDARPVDLVRKLGLTVSECESVSAHTRDHMEKKHHTGDAISIMNTHAHCSNCCCCTFFTGSSRSASRRAWQASAWSTVSGEIRGREGPVNQWAAGNRSTTYSSCSSGCRCAAIT